MQFLLGFDAFRHHFQIQRMCQSDAHVPGRFQRVNTVLDVLHDYAFSDFQFQSLRRMCVDSDFPLDFGDEAVAAQLHRR